MLKTPRASRASVCMCAVNEKVCIFCIADIIGYIEVFCNFSVVDCDLLQLQERLLLPYL